MKKNKILKISIFALLIAFSIVIYKYLTIEEKEVIRVKKSTAYDTVVCNGTVEPKNKKHILFNKPLTVDEVFVELGEKVKENDLLFTVIINGYKKDVLSETKGIIDTLNVSSGDYFEANKLLATVLNTEQIFIKALVSENDINKIKTRQKATAECSACNDIYTCNVNKIYSNINRMSTQNQGNFLSVLLSVNDADNDIIPGFSSTVTINVNKYKNVFVVPESSIFKENNQYYVYTVNNRRAKKTAVTKSINTSKGTVIIHGLLQDDMVIYSCSDISDGDLLKVNEIEF